MQQLKDGVGSDSLLSRFASRVVFLYTFSSGPDISDGVRPSKQLSPPLQMVSLKPKVL